jgi:hypothetical protein
MNARGIRFSLRSLLTLIVLLAIVLAVVRWNTDWIASVCISVLLMIQGVSIVAAFCQKGRARVFWLGFAIFSWGYGSTVFQHDRLQRSWPLSFSFGSYPSTYAPVGPADIADRVFQLIDVSPDVGDTVSAKYLSGGVYPAIVKQIGNDGQMLVAWTDGSAPSWVNNVAIESTNGRVAGHALLAIMIALLAGYICQPVFDSGSAVHS